jgi:hypothetical protein
MKSLPTGILAVFLSPFIPQALAHPHDDDHHAPLLTVAAALPVATQPAPAAAVIGGSGAFRYQYLPDKLVLPPEVKMRHGHGLCHDPAGNIYFTYEPEKVELATRCLVRFAPDGTRPELLGSDNTLAFGAPHGLNIHVDAAGKAHLYHANNDATVSKTTLDGATEWTQKWPPAMGNYKPTDVVVTPDGQRVLVADGYGSSMVHALNTADGIYAGKSWGGLGAAHGEFNCPHGITFDPRRKLLLVADRGNHRLEYFSPGGIYQGSVETPASKAPCNADFWGDFVLVPDLDGPLVILDKDNQAVSVIEVGKLLGSQGFQHPHDAIWLPNGDIVVCTWNPGRLGYWQRLPADSGQ